MYGTAEWFFTEKLYIRSLDFAVNCFAIKLFKKDEEGKKEYQGILKKYTEQDIIIEDNENKQKQINRKNISQIKTVYNWE